MVQLNLLSIVAAVLSMPLASNAQGNVTMPTFISDCIANNGIAMDGEVLSQVNEKCCSVGSSEPLCVLYACADFDTGLAKEPCICGEITGAVAALEDPTVSGEVTDMLAPVLEPTSAALKECCASDATTATEFNSCLMNLIAGATGPTDTATASTTGAVDFVGSTEPTTDTATTGVTDAATTDATVFAAGSTTTGVTDVTTTKATESFSTTTKASYWTPPTETKPSYTYSGPAPAPSSASIVSVSLRVMVAYALFNYAM